ncbi:HPP family protein [Frischella perrara]|uniref:CBS-domain-containing membrane protein n=1 Tax=Frischella perrara TaxID=1267021 RepID=A0A0A7S251_FRIPE|nr:HPP family protein [Frischella perrara]AJA44877.1 CBS-domain-containing membrane protein [Frischella perrara]PWV59411.1 HPP family protein [Frischella perrara]
MLRKITGGEAIQPTPNFTSVLRGFVGGSLGISVLLAVTYWAGTPSIMAPFGATCVLLFAVPKAPLAQPRSVIGGHFVSALVGLLAIHLFGDGMLTVALAVGISIASMQLLRVVHAPAGANPILIIMSGITDYSFLFTPVLMGSVLLVIVALIVNNIGAGSRWPSYWFGHSLNMFSKNTKSKED